MANPKNIDDYEKQSLIQDEPTSQPIQESRLSFRERLVRYVFPCILLLLSMSLLFRKVFVCHHKYTPDKYFPLYDDVENTTNGTKVALEAHIMSKCPDAKACLEQLVVPTMAQVHELVDFKLSYIGSLESKSDDVHCMHGPSECLGNIIQLCAAHVYPDPVIYLPFASCMTSQYSRIPDKDLIQDCALEHGVDFGKLNDCISQEGEGIELLRESVKHSQEVGVRTSCTVRLAGEVRCVRDGGKWKDCPGGSSVSDLVDDIESLYVMKNLQH